MSVKKDCFAYGNTFSPSCKCLDDLYCADSACSFYKTKEQAEEDTRRAQERLRLKLKLAT